jgi:hypothetical protein
MLPKITSTILDGGLGIRPASTGDLPCVVGTTPSGTAATPTLISTVTDLLSTFGHSETSELAARILTQTGKPVVVVSTGTTTDGSIGTLDITHVTGTCDPTATAASKPVDKYEVKVLITTGGTKGTAGIKYRISLDNGRTYGPILSLGTAAVIADTDSGVSFDLAAGTLVAGDYWTAPTVAPAWNTTQLDAALDSLITTSLPFDTIVVAGPVDGTSIDTISTWASAAFTAQCRKQILCSFRMPNATGETDAQYVTAVNTALGAKSSKFVGVATGSAYVVSPVSARSYNRSALHAIVDRFFSLYLGQDAAQVDLGPLTGVSLHDTNGALQHHDERASQGLDDERTICLRTFQGMPGVYVNNPKMLHASGSDYVYYQYTRCMNAAIDTVEPVLTQRLSKPVVVNTKTGKIREEDAQDIESVCNSALRDALMSIPSVSSVTFVLSRQDNIISTGILHYTVRIVPMGYTKEFIGEFSFVNPAVRSA